MLGDIRQAKNVYIVCGYTDMRKGLNSLVPFVQQNFGIDPYSSSLFLFCGKRCDRLKALLWEPDCKNRHPSPICTRFEHHLAGVLAPLSRTEATKPYNWFSTAKL